MLDTLIKNATILDGTGRKAHPGCVGIKNGRLALDGVGALTPAIRTIDAKGRYLAPGFIDAHSHGDLIFDREFSMRAKLCQGITTHIAGQCGDSVFPCGEGHESQYREICSLSNDRIPPEWNGFRSMRAFLNTFEKTPVALNMGTFVGHNSIRAAVMGFENRAPSPEELDRMCALLEEALECGAMGMSTGLVYMPGCFAAYPELLALAKVLARHGAIYVTHMRDESNRVTDAIRETLSLGREAGCRVWISHHKTSGIRNWGRSAETLHLIDEALGEGLDVMLDQYPFAASMTVLAACFPPERLAVGAEKLIEQLKDPAFRKTMIREMQTEGDYENTFLNAGSFHRIQYSGSAADPRAEGMRADEYAALVGKDPFDAMFDLYSMNKGTLNAVYYTMSEEDVQRIFLHPHTVIGTDGITRSETERTHPRAFGTFPRAINWFVREKHLVTLEEAVRKGTGLTADAFRLKNKGRIAEGLDADLVLFDLDLLSSCATFDDPGRPCDGILKVFVAGKAAWENGRMTGERAGRFVPRPE